MIIKSNLDEIQNYLTDSSNLKGYCEKVFIPENIDEIVECIKYCYENNIPYTISGGGTGLVGGRVPFEGVLISTEKLNRILDFNSNDGTVLVEAGVVRKDLDDYLANLGYFLPPNPTETNSFVGGNIACNSSGARTFKYGTTRDYVLELDVVLPSGELVGFQRNDYNIVTNSKYHLELSSGKIIEFDIPKLPYVNTTKNTAGYYLHKGMHLLDIFIGSEGTLGTIVRAKLKVLPLPQKVVGLIIFFDNLENSLSFITETRRLSKNSFDATNGENLISARLIEFFDYNSLSLLFEDFPQIPKNSSCAVWVEQEYSPDEEFKILDAWMEHISQFTTLAEQTWIAIHEVEHRRFAEFRHLIPTRVFEIVSKTQFQKIGSDVSVHAGIFKNYYLKLVKELEASKLQYFIWGHFGNSHLHLNIIPRNEQEESLAKEIYDKHITEAITMGGTYSAEHGTGKLKRKYLEIMYGKDIVEKMKAIKLQFDPKNLLGRGILFF
ncbi:MAG: FAD-binding oxidoreductase [Ignavibacteria bacterium]|nr:FAD-binding oxidoreductase [Ignavibacteria bacterium]